MVQRVNVNGVIHQFPDEATPQMIAEALGVQPPDDSSTNAVSSGSDESIFSAIKNAITSNYPTSVADKRAGLAKSSGNTVIDALQGLLSGGISGLGKGGQFIAKTLTGGYAPSGDIDKLANAVGPQDDSLVGNVAKGFGQYAPYAAIGGATLPGQLAAGALSGAATTGSDESNLFGLLPSGKTGGAIESAVLNALTHGGAKALEALRPSNVLRGTQTPEELQKNLDVTQGTETGLGEVIGSPALKRLYQNILTRIPFSGATQALQRTGQGVVSKGENILSNMLGQNSPENIPEQLTQEIQQRFKAHKDEKNALYTNANNIADEIGLNLELPTFAKKATQFSDALANTNMLQFEPDTQKVFRKLQNYKNPVITQPDLVTYTPDTLEGALTGTSGKPVVQEGESIYPTLQEANILKGTLGSYAKQLAKSSSSQDRYASGVYGQLSDALKSDIKSSIANSQSDKLKTAYADAEENYRKNFSPFLDKKIYNYISGSRDPETLIRDFVKTSPTADMASDIGHLAKILPKEGLGKLSYSYFSRAMDNDGNLNPAKLSTLVNKLGSNQFKTLVPDQNMRNQLKNYTRLEGLNKGATTTLFNPPTGQQALDVLTTGVLSNMGSMLGGRPGALIGPMAAIGGGKLATKALTSEAVRNNLVKKMINNKPMFTGGSKIPTYQAAQQALVNALGGGNNQ